MNYEEMSDFEINKLVAIATQPAGSVEWNGHYVVQIKNEHNGAYIGWKTFNPCNNPSDAWPIIVENEIDIQFRQGTKMPPMARHTNDYAIHKNPLRAAMIVYLMMNEDK